MARTVSYIARNERKYADRRIKQLRKDLKGATHEDKLLTRRAISNIQKLKAATYIKGRNPAARAQAMEGVLKLRQATRLEKNTAHARQNLITKREVNLASTGKRKTFLGSPELSRAKIKIFYQATRNLWQGVPTNMRNEAILIALGEKSLKKAIQKVLAHNQEALDYAGEVLHASKRSAKNFHASPLWQYANFVDAQGSPEYLDLVHEVENLDKDKLSVDTPNLNINELFRENLETSQDLNEFYTKFSSSLNVELKQNEGEIAASGQSVDEVRADVMELVTNAINKARKDSDKNILSTIQKGWKEAKKNVSKEGFKANLQTAKHNLNKQRVKENVKKGKTNLKRNATKMKNKLNKLNRKEQI